MFISKASVSTLVEKLNVIDKFSRRKSLTPEEQAILAVEAIKAVRSTLSIIRKLK